MCLNVTPFVFSPSLSFVETLQEDKVVSTFSFPFSTTFVLVAHLYKSLCPRVWAIERGSMANK